MQSYYYGKEPLHTMDLLRRANPDYFRAPQTHEPYDTRIPMAPVLLTKQSTSLLVVRIGHREKVERTTQNSWRKKWHYSNAPYYRISHKTWNLIEISWADGSIKELGSYATPQEANDALLTKHDELMNM